VTTIFRAARGSDNWPATWAHDDALYTAYGDGWGFEPKRKGKLSLGLAKVAGSPGNIHGVNLNAPTAEQTGDGSHGKKASGMLMVDGKLYMLAREPWGPWSTVYDAARWDIDPGESASFPTKWMSPDGRADEPRS